MSAIRPPSRGEDSPRDRKIPGKPSDILLGLVRKHGGSLDIPDEGLRKAVRSASRSSSPVHRIRQIYRDRFTPEKAEKLREVGRQFRRLRRRRRASSRTVSSPPSARRH